MNKGRKPEKRREERGKASGVKRSKDVLGGTAWRCRGKERGKKTQKDTQ